MEEHHEWELEKRDLLAILDISNAVTSTHNSKQILYSIVKKISEIIDVKRCSIVRIDADESKGYVVASNEDPDIFNIEINFKKYPEILEVLKNKEIVVIRNIRMDPLMFPVKEYLEDVGFHSLLVIPLIMKKNVIGAILLRTARQDRSFEEREIQFCQIAANAAANALVNASLFESMELANLHLEKLATTDDLTGIFNRRYFYRRLDEEFNRAERYNNPLSMMMLDVDDFKKINDTYGHKAGDDVLKKVAFILKNNIREDDIVARYGGDEFMIALPKTDLKEAKALAGHLMHAILSYRFEIMQGFNIQSSYGISVYPDKEIQSPDDMVSVADRELYLMKSKNKKRSCDKGK